MVRLFLSGTTPAYKVSFSKRMNSKATSAPGRIKLKQGSKGWVTGHSAGKQLVCDVFLVPFPAFSGNSTRKQLVCCVLEPFPVDLSVTQPLSPRQLAA